MTSSFENLRTIKDYRNIINNSSSQKPSDRDFLSLSDKYNISSDSLHSIEDLIFLGFKYDDKYIVPEYQRNLVWTLEQKQSLILSILFGNPIGDFLFKVEANKDEDTFFYTVIDGQQRLNAIREFALGNFALPNNLTITDLKYWDARHFFEFRNFSAFKIKNISLEDEINIYLNRNCGGTTHSSSDIEKARNFLA